jgi:hypothetical protein
MGARANRVGLPVLSPIQASTPSTSFRALLLRSPTAGKGPDPIAHAPADGRPATSPARSAIAQPPAGRRDAGVHAASGDDVERRVGRATSREEPDFLGAHRPISGAFGEAFSLTHLPSAVPLAGEVAPSARAAASLDDLLPSLVRRIAWSGDRRRGTLWLEIGAGELSGATLLVEAEGGRVRVRLEVPPGVNGCEWQRRIAGRLAARGVATDSVEVA